jgi:hypothetical protein
VTTVYCKKKKEEIGVLGCTVHFLSTNTEMKKLKKKEKENHDTCLNINNKLKKLMF